MKKLQNIGENKASFQISKHIIGKNITINNPVNGRADLFSKINGLLDYDSKLLFKLNFSNDELAVAMMKTIRSCKKKPINRKCKNITLCNEKRGKKHSILKNT